MVLIFSNVILNHVKTGNHNQIIAILYIPRIIYMLIFTRFINFNLILKCSNNLIRFF